MTGKRSNLETKFALLWQSINGEPYEDEHRFHPTRRWRFDFAWPSKKIAVEIEGGTWTGGRHTRGAGFQKDCEKYNAAAVLGWTVLRFTAGDLNGCDKQDATMAAITEALKCATATPAKKKTS